MDQARAREKRVRLTSPHTRSSAPVRLVCPEVVAYDPRMAKRRLPTGISEFRELRERDCYYVDKTPYIERLLREGKYYFLSRPRRFGKSLLIDTIKELFEGNEPLFEGLQIHRRWNWSDRHPVVRLDFGHGTFDEPGLLEANTMQQLAAAERRLGVEPKYLTTAGRFAYLLQALHRQTGKRVAVLVDEYDKPILDVLDRPEVARANRDFLLGLYGTIKSNDATRATKASMFSGPQQSPGSDIGPALRVDLRLHQERSGPRVRLQNWPVWTGSVSASAMAATAGAAKSVYNPFDVLSLFGSREFKAHWFDAGDPSVLVGTLFERRVSSVSLSGLLGTEELLSAYDVNRIGTEALLFQTGYLTIAEEQRLGGMALYRLGYPNREVRESLNRVLLRHLVQDAAQQTANSIRLAHLLETHDCAAMKELFHAFFASIPYHWYTNNRIADYEGFYASVFYSYFAALGYDITVEESSSHGRLDMAVRAAGHVYLFEFKVAEMSSPPAPPSPSSRSAATPDKYRAAGEPIHLVGVEFSRDTRNITAFATADA